MAYWLFAGKSEAQRRCFREELQGPSYKWSWEQMRQRVWTLECDCGVRIKVQGLSAVTCPHCSMVWRPHGPLPEYRRARRPWELRRTEFGIV